MGELRLVVGSSGTGKTTKMVELALVVLGENKPVTLFSLEETSLLMELLFISQMTGTQRNSLLEARKQMECLLETEKQVHNVALAKLKGNCHGRLTIYDNIFNISGISEVIQKSIDKDFYVDYFDLFYGIKEYKDRKDAMNTLYEITKFYDINLTVVLQQIMGTTSITRMKQQEIVNIADAVVYMTPKLVLKEK